MNIKAKTAFSLIEILIVVMMISAGILPIFSLMRSGQERISRADTRTMATLFGASGIELARTLGYDRAQNLPDEEEFKRLVSTAESNGFDVTFAHEFQAVTPLPPGAKEHSLLRITIKVTSKVQTAGPGMPELTFATILTDPRYSYY